MPTKKKFLEKDQMLSLLKDIAVSSEGKTHALVEKQHAKSAFLDSQEVKRKAKLSVKQLKLEEMKLKLKEKKRLKKHQNKADASKAIGKIDVKSDKKAASEIDQKAKKRVRFSVAK